MPTFQYNIPRRDRTAFVFLSRNFNAIWNNVAPLRPLRFWHHARHPSQPHRFTSDAFVASGVVQPIPAPYFPQPFQSWRLMSLLQFGVTCLWYIWLLWLFIYNLGLILQLELATRIISFVLRKSAIINKSLSFMSIYKRFTRYHVGNPSCLKLLFSIPAPNRFATRPQLPCELYPG